MNKNGGYGLRMVCIRKVVLCIWYLGVEFEGKGVEQEDIGIRQQA